MRKIIPSLVLILITVLSLSTTAFAASSVEQARAWAEEVGLPPAFLNSAYDDLILQIYNDNKSANNIEFEITVKHGSEAFDPNLLTEGAPNALDLWCVAAKVSTAEGYVEYANIYVYYVWNMDFDEEGLLGSQDAIRLTWDPSIWTRTTNSIFATELAGANTNSVYHTSVRPANSGQGYAEWGIPIETAQGTPYGSAKIQLFPVDTQMKTDTEYTSSFDVVYDHEPIAETTIRPRYIELYALLAVPVICICIRKHKSK